MSDHGLTTRTAANRMDDEIRTNPCPPGRKRAAMEDPCATHWPQAPTGGTRPRSAYVFVNERGQPFGRFGIGRMIERAGEAAGLPFPCPRPHAAARAGVCASGPGGGHTAATAFLGHASITTQCAIPLCRRSPSKTFGAKWQQGNGALQRSPFDTGGEFNQLPWWPIAPLLSALEIRIVRASVQLAGLTGR